MTEPETIQDLFSGPVSAQILIEETRATVAETNRVIQQTRERITRTRRHSQSLLTLAQAMDKPDEAAASE